MPYISFDKNYIVSTVSDHPITISEENQTEKNNSLQNIKNKYYNDYAGLKADFGVPVTVDFAITSDDYSLTRQVPEATDVLAGVYRKPVLYGNGSIINQDFIIKICRNFQFNIFIQRGYFFRAIA